MTTIPKILDNMDDTDNERIENEIDIKLFDKAMAKSKVTYTLNEVKKELAIKKKSK